MDKKKLSLNTWKSDEKKTIVRISMREINVRIWERWDWNHFLSNAGNVSIGI